MTAVEVMAALSRYATADDAMFLQRFFKTGKGQYGEGDQFIGVRVPQTRKVCRQFRDLPLDEVQKLLNSSVHEHRLAAAILLANQYPIAGAPTRQAIYNLYLKNLYGGRINNWDIVDVTCAQVVGAHLEDRPRDVLYSLARSPHLWEKRTAIISTFWFLRKNCDASTSLDMAEILVDDAHDLIQKAVGWTVREVGKHCGQDLLMHFLDQHARTMPRTALRYALEKLTPEQKLYYMQLKNS